MNLGEADEIFHACLRMLCLPSSTTDTAPQYKIEIVSGVAVGTKRSWDLWGFIKIERHSLSFLAISRGSETDSHEV